MERQQQIIDGLPVHVFDTRAEMGAAAARGAAHIIREAIDKKGEANVVFAAAPSQDDLIASLLGQDIDWRRVRGFHQDEYIGLDPAHSAGFGNFLRRVPGHPFLALCHRIGKALDDIGIFFQVTFLGKVCRIGNFACGFAHTGHNIAFALGLHRRRGRLEHRYIVAGAAQKGARHHVELHGVIQKHIVFRIQPGLLQCIFKCHVGHAALAPRQDMCPGKVRPLEIRHGLARHKEAAVALCHLRKHLGIVLFALVVHIYAGFGPGKPDIHTAGQHGAHHLICPTAV